MYAPAHTAFYETDIPDESYRRRSFVIDFHIIVDFVLIRCLFSKLSLLEYKIK